MNEQKGRKKQQPKRRTQKCVVWLLVERESRKPVREGFALKVYATRGEARADAYDDESVVRAEAFWSDREPTHA